MANFGNEYAGLFLSVLIKEVEIVSAYSKLPLIKFDINLSFKSFK